MSRTDSLPVKDLTLDLQNFRTVQQPDELSAVHALIAIDTDPYCNRHGLVLGTDGESFR
jgi:hypothetical protein